MNCNNGTLSVYIPNGDNPWDISKVLFLFRRIGFSIKFSDVENYLNSNPPDLIDSLITNAKNMPLSPDPGWAHFDNADFNASVINSIIVHDDSNNGDTLTVTITDASSNVFQIFEKSVSGHATEELLTRDLILQEGEILKVQASTANRLHVVASIQEFAIHRTPQVDL